MQHHVGNRLTDNVRTPDDNHFGTACFNSGAYNHFLDAGRGAGRKFDFLAADHQTAHIDRVESIHILVRINGIEHLFFIQMLWQRKLNQNTMNGIVVVVLVDQTQQRFLGNILRLAVLNFLKTQFIGSFDFQRYIRNGSGVFPDQNGYQTRHDAVLFFNFCHLIFNFL